MSNDQLTERARNTVDTRTFPRALTDYSVSELQELLKELGQPKYRVKQIRSGLYHRLCTSYDELTDLSKALRHKLLQREPLTALREHSHSTSADGLTTKLLLQALDGELIETVSIREEDRHTVCVSSQIGCAMGCAFCASGLAGLGRNLRGSEIVEQVLTAQRRFGKVTNVVFMGMGEPLRNYTALQHALHTLNDADAFGLAARRMTISTVGVVRGIERLANEGLQVELAVSLHAPDDEIRRQIIPSAKRWSVRQIMDAVAEFTRRTNRRVTLEYLLLGGLNDAPEHARKLAALARRAGACVNLIPWNPVPEVELQQPPRNAVLAFRDILQDAGISVTIRKEKGRDVDAACGQLRRRATSGESQ